MITAVEHITSKRRIHLGT